MIGITAISISINLYIAVCWLLLKLANHTSPPQTTITEHSVNTSEKIIKSFTQYQLRDKKTECFIESSFNDLSDAVIQFEEFCRSTAKDSMRWDRHMQLLDSTTIRRILNENAAVLCIDRYEVVQCKFVTIELNSIELKELVKEEAS